MLELSVMTYASNAKTNLNEALRIFEDLCKQGSMSKIEQKKFFIAVEKYRANFNSWYSCSPANANAYQVFVKSTPLAPLMELTQDKWIAWLETYISEKSSS